MPRARKNDRENNQRQDVLHQVINVFWPNIYIYIYNLGRQEDFWILKQNPINYYNKHKRKYRRIK